ncbi:hypothetical protein ACRE1S_03500 [Helicobacter himalayensis]|uniref:hypothetical protein n=1 Tax=Helicobacter himalayensis TaxID=1591088 RepID=UPI003D6EB2FF
MQIDEVKTAFKIADVEFVEGSTRLNFNYLKDLKDENGNPLPQKILTQNKNIKGLFGLKNVKNAYISYKLIEQCCVGDYLSVEKGKYPEWNVQEQGMDWPLDIKNEHTEILKNSPTREKIIKRKEMKR